MVSHVVPEQQADQRVLNMLRRTGGCNVVDLIQELGVTATAVRQRLNRLMRSGLIERVAQQQKRGRPSHQYRLTKKGEQEAGTNYVDLAAALWEEIRAIEEPKVRAGLLGRIADRMATRVGLASGGNLAERMERLARFMGERQVPLEVDTSSDSPMLTVLACPYPTLAEHDRGVCAMERMMFSELLGESMKLTACRLDGANCCTFEPSA